MNADPGNGLLPLPETSKLLYLGPVHGDEGVAGHALLDRRHTGTPGLINRVVAEVAGQAHLGHVDPVAEGYGLPGALGLPGPDKSHPENQDGKEAKVAGNDD